MPKPTIKKTAPVIAAPAVKTRNRQPVFVQVTASKLHELIGDREIGVSRKALTAIILKDKSGDLLSDLGL